MGMSIDSLAFPVCILQCNGDNDDNMKMMVMMMMMIMLHLQVCLTDTLNSSFVDIVFGKER